MWQYDGCVAKCSYYICIFKYFEKLKVRDCYYGSMKMFTAKAKELILIPETRTVERENGLWVVFLSPTYRLK